MQIGSRSGYWVAQWKEDWDPSLKEFIDRFPESVIGNHVVIASCDSGPYRPKSDELAAGWRIEQGIAVSPKLKEPSQLPMPGFDEWYIYKEIGTLGRHENFVNTFGFSPLELNNEKTNAFWDQVEAFRPLHVLGAGTPVMFFVTSDEALYKKVANV